jgi:hypothetical protein
LLMRRFDPRPREGATRRKCQPKGHLIRFDPRPREGATATKLIY